ncbi:MAG TPA: hypothetical protein VGH43_11400 [Jatrophihabitans sp.]
MVALVALGPRYEFHYAFLFLLVLIGPLWIGAFGRFRLGRLVAFAVLITAFWGYYLAQLSSATHLVSAAHARDDTMLLIGALCGIGVILWARTVLTTAQIGICYGVGLLLDTVISPVGTSNPWKFVYAVPVTILVLGLAARSTRTGPAIVAMVALAGLSVVLDCRSYSTALLLAALLSTWRSLPQRSGKSKSWALTATMIGAVSVAIFLLIQSLLVNGYLGAAAQERTIQQINVSGSLILGGRPELEASLALFGNHPAGFGVGVVPSPQDILVAKSGLSSINYAPDNGYVEKYMFGYQYELHSVAGDVWAKWGLLGLALVVGIAMLVVRTLAMSIANRSGEPLVLFLCCWTSWSLAFSPLVASLPIIVPTVAMCLRSRVGGADCAPAHDASG